MKFFTPLNLNLPDTPRDSILYETIFGIYQALSNFLDFFFSRDGQLLCIAGEDLAHNRFACMQNNGHLFYAANTDISTAAICFVPNPVKGNNTGVFDFSNNVQSGFAGLIPGRIYYLGDSLGGIVLSPPVASGTIVQEVGVALSATELFVRIQSSFVNP